ncbi:carboxypeptidase-like regulatory domain-containing protein [Polaribacter sp. Asnod1-A03]|uniref:carboxypeptidase-like regulatory domain-containing protein n=1 Tax=Polaribacter sp. Asnod1-A03 TaxID=3160581 RepID=UPI00386BDD63
MKNRFFVVLFLLVYSSLFSQTIIKGKVTTINKIPLDGAAVYLNNTMIGTTTNSNGEFKLPIQEGTHELIISFMGYKRINYLLDSNKKAKSFHFLLEEDENLLDEIIIGKTKYDTEWKYNLEIFKREFLGLTLFSKNCTILNPKVLHFNFDAKKSTLTTFAKEPLQIKNKSLGYIITYDLISFTRKQNYVSYLGYARYQNLEGGRNKQKSWKKNRLLAYNGSTVHFLKSVINNNFKAEGFNVSLFKRVPNKDRPSEETIKKARELLKLNRNDTNFSKNLDDPKNAIDSALVIIRKVKLPKYKDFLYKSNITADEIISKKDGNYFLDFENNISVTYTKEKEEKGFILRNAFSKMRTPSFQNSYVIPLKKLPSILDKRGILVNSLDVFYEGYWSYEKFANSLPLDYNPDN